MTADLFECDSSESKALFSFYAYALTPVTCALHYNNTANTISQLDVEMPRTSRHKYNKDVSPSNPSRIKQTWLTHL